MLIIKRRPNLQIVCKFALQTSNHDAFFDPFFSLLFSITDNGSEYATHGAAG
jgi:hypothetical protein